MDNVLRGVFVRATASFPLGKIRLELGDRSDNPRGVYVIAATQETADLVASMIVDGVLANLYPDKASVLAAWRAYPLPLHSRYGVWVASVIETSPEGFKIVSTKRVEVSP